MLRFLTRLSRPVKQAIIVGVDLLMIPVAIFAAFSLQMNGLPPLEGLVRHWPAIPLLMLIGGLLAVVMGIHKIQLKAFENRAIGMSAIHALTMGLATAMSRAASNSATASSRACDQAARTVDRKA